MKSSTTATKVSVKPRVYSYIRFSTPEQKLGDSQRRQIEVAKEYAKKHDLIFDEELRDEGLSGWSGSHVKKGNLGRFLERVKAGQVPNGSVLFVEDLDRLSREGITEALGTVVGGLIQCGITIATPTDTYDRESINNGGIYRLIGKLENAHDESQKKSERLSRAWAEKKRRARDEKVVATSRVPLWLKVVNGKCVPDPKAVKTVQLIFELASSLGSSRLVKKLNKEAPWTPPARRNMKGSGWRISYVRKILANRAVLGEYQPHTRQSDGRRIEEGEPIEGYFPRIIEPATFYAVQSQRKENKERRFGGRTGGAFNLFTNLAICAYCQGAMIYRNRGATSKGGQYLVCDKNQRGMGCSARGVRYREIQETILNNCATLQPEKVLPSEPGLRKKRELLQIRISGAQEEIASNEERITNLVSQIASTKIQSIRNRYEKRITEIEEANLKLDVELEKDKRALRKAETTSISFKKWQQALDALKTAIAPKNAIDARLRLRSHLKEFIERIEVFSHGYCLRFDAASDNGSPKEPNSDDLSEQIEAYADEYEFKISHAELRKFISFVMQRRMSVKGRFYRVHFKGGVTKDLVPQNSLASGEALYVRRHNKWRYVSPDLDKLYKEYTAAQSPRRLNVSEKKSPAD